LKQVSTHRDIQNALFNQAGVDTVTKRTIKTSQQYKQGAKELACQKVVHFVSVYLKPYLSPQKSTMGQRLFGVPCSQAKLWKDLKSLETNSTMGVVYANIEDIGETRKNLLEGGFEGERLTGRKSKYITFFPLRSQEENPGLSLPTMVLRVLGQTCKI